MKNTIKITEKVEKTLLNIKVEKDLIFFSNESEYYSTYINKKHLTKFIDKLKEIRDIQ